MIIMSLVIVVLGYTLVEHAFSEFLFPDHHLSERLYAAASIPWATFDILIVVLTAGIVLGWLAAYYTAAKGRTSDGKASGLRLAFYSLISREFYVADVYTWLTQTVLSLSRRLNGLLRWV